MKNIKIPDEHQAVMPYLILNGAEKFLSFMKLVFDAQELSKHLDDTGNIMHAEIRIGQSTIMYANSTDQWEAQTAGLFIYVADADETYAKALKNGALSVMDLADKDYGRTCGIKDPLGNIWWITSMK